MPIRTTRLFVSKTPMQIFDERGYTVEISDDCAGEYVTLKDGMGGSVGLDPDVWPELIIAINDMIGLCKTEQEDEDEDDKTGGTK